VEKKKGLVGCYPFFSKTKKKKKVLPYLSTFLKVEEGGEDISIGMIA
jgi:hypothetical protein